MAAGTLHDAMDASKAASEALAIHRRVCVADGHADALMWNRDLTVGSERGHVDFPG